MTGECEQRVRLRFAVGRTDERTRVVDRRENRRAMVGGERSPHALVRVRNQCTPRVVDQRGRVVRFRRIRVVGPFVARGQQHARQHTRIRQRLADEHLVPRLLEIDEREPYESQYAETLGVALLETPHRPEEGEVGAANAGRGAVQFVGECPGRIPVASILDVHQPLVELARRVLLVVRDRERFAPAQVSGNSATAKFVPQGFELLHAVGSGFHARDANAAGDA